MHAFQVVLVVVSASSVVLIGCAKPTLDVRAPSGVENRAAKVALGIDLGPSRNTPRHRMLATVKRVVAPVRASAILVCLNLALTRERCDAVADAHIRVYSGERDVNAFADQWNNIGILGGLLRTMGDDGEIAAVLAHEYAHVMLGHVKMKFKNALAGAALAGGLAAWSQSRSQSYDPAVVENAMLLGAAIGGRAYSQTMEIEADRVAVYILQGASPFESWDLPDAIVRLVQSNKAKRGFLSILPAIGFLRTHPASDERVAKILAAIVDVDRGVELKVTGR